MLLIFAKFVLAKTGKGVGATIRDWPLIDVKLRGQPSASVHESLCAIYLDKNKAQLSGHFPGYTAHFLDLVENMRGCREECSNIAPPGQGLP